MAPTVLQLMEIEPPPELAAALSVNFLDRLGIANPPPVQIAELEQWGGYCHEENATERGEVIISDWRTPRPSWSIAHGIQGTYMHEAAHRLIWLRIPVKAASRTDVMAATVLIRKRPPFR